MLRIVAAARALFRCLGRREGAVLVWFGITAIPLLLAVGVAIDIARAYAVKVRLEAAIDDAGLAVATTLDPTINATTRLNKYFYGNFVSTQIGTATAVSYVNDATVANAIDVTGTATVPTTFMALAGFNSITVQDTAQIIRRAPNIDFYLMLDSSPSMAIAATQTDINTMVNHTSAQGGCAFGCHQQTTTATCASSDVAGNPNDPTTGHPMDNYALARSLGVTLRIDLLRQAAQNLTTTATNTAATNQAQYRMAVYTFDVNFNTIQTLTNSMSTVSTAAGNIQQLQVYCNNWLTSSNNNSDADTNFDTAFSSIGTIMPAPGNGSNIAGDTPQEVLFLVTDGVEDENTTYSTQTPTSSSYGNLSGSRQESIINVANCTAIKNRGIRIAVLYTEYLPLPTNSWYNNHVSPFQSNIASTLQSCASPGLYFMVTTGGDISGALSTLFEEAVQSAYLAQ
jgi:Flp pilus assembly protein TadG